MTRKRKMILIAVAVIVVLAAAIALMITIADRNGKAIEQIVIEDFDLSLVPDGTYTGNYNAFPVVVDVEVTVGDHVITAIDLIKHMNGQGSGSEVIPGKILEAQTLLVDTVSGATYSSKVILLAVQNALQNKAGE
jgi:uncharacterized protein with FMN-binding domain